MAAAVESVGAAAVAGVSEGDLKGIVQLAKQQVSRGVDSSGGDEAVQGNLLAKGAYTYVMDLLAHCVREKMDAETLSQHLQEAQVPAGHAGIIVKALMPEVPGQRAAAPSSTALEELVDAGWRLDYVTRTSASGKVNQQQYILRLVSRTPATGEVASVEVAATKQQLEALQEGVTQALQAAEAFLPKTRKAGRKAGK